MNDTMTYSSNKKYAVHFGAGNIGRGFIGNVLSQSGFHVVFIDVQKDIIDAINRNAKYEVRIIEGDKIDQTETITNVSGILATPHNQEYINEAIAHASVITTAIGVSLLNKIAPTITTALQYRLGITDKLINVIACENKIGASSILRSEIINCWGEEYQKLIDTKVGFPNCGVDRIVVTNKKYIGSDILTVCVEKYKEWGIDANKYLGEKDISEAHFTEKLDAYAERKLFTLNTGHAIMSYLGYLHGKETIHEAISDDEIYPIVRSAMLESAVALEKKWGLDKDETERYVDLAIERVGNKLLEDKVARVGREVLRKLTPNDRLIYPLNMCAEYDLPRSNIIKGISAALCFTDKDDVEAQQLSQLIKNNGLKNVLIETCGIKEQKDVNDIITEYEHMAL